jgi:6-phosphogluconolactonase
MAIAPNGKAVYVQGSASGLHRFNLTADGTLVNSVAATADSRDGPVALAVTPDSAHVYLATQSALGHYTVSPDGNLAPAEWSKLDAAAEALTVTPDGKTLLLVDRAGRLLAYRIAANGTIVEAWRLDVTSEQPRAIAIATNGKYVYVTSGNRVHQLALRADGTVTPLVPASIAAGQGAASIAITADSATLYVGNFFNQTVSQYAIGADGTLRPLAQPDVRVVGQVNQVVVFYR